MNYRAAGPPSPSHTTKIHIRGFRKLSNWLLKQFSLNIFFKAESCVTVQQETITDSNTASFYNCWLKQSCFSKYSGWSVFNNTVQRATVAVLTVRAVDERKGHNDFMGCARLVKCCLGERNWLPHISRQNPKFFCRCIVAGLNIWMFACVILDISKITRSLSVCSRSFSLWSSELLLMLYK